jgi:hypothetical protein
MGEAHSRCTLMITKYLFDEPLLRTFIQKHFENLIVAPIQNKARSSVIEKVRNVIALRHWFDREIKSDATLVLLDKSSVYSRFFIKRFFSVILFQQLEQINSNFNLDVKSTLLDLVRSILLGSCFAVHYVCNHSGGTIRSLKFRPCGRKKNFRIFLNALGTNKNLRPNFPVFEIQKKLKIVIFGSRFRSWPYFAEGKSEVSLRRLSTIYKFIWSKFRCYELYYIPHPLEAGDEFHYVNYLFRGNLKIPTGYFSSEHFLYENRDIAFTFSIGSTASLSAYSMGFSAKVLYKMLAFPNSVESTYDEIFSSVPPAFFAKCLSDLVIPEARVSTAETASLFDRFFLDNGGLH